LTTRIVNKYKEPYDVDITRASKWGNPFKIEKDKSGKEIPGSRENVIRQFRDYIIKRDNLLKLIPVEIKDKTLGCVCKPKPCHGDVLVELADR
jgi:hypothetical protein